MPEANKAVFSPGILAQYYALIAEFSLKWEWDRAKCFDVVAGSTFPICLVWGGHWTG